MDAVGLAASVLSSVLYIPQIVHTIQTKSTRDLSFLFIGFGICASALWLAYGIGTDTLPIIISASVAIAGWITFFSLKCYYDNLSPNHRPIQLRTMDEVMDEMERTSTATDNLLTQFHAISRHGR